MNALLTAAAAVVAVVAAARSTWSPCGVSMLATVTPLAERARGHRYRSTATWFVAGGTVGGATLGLVMAALALGVRAAAPSTVVLAAIACCRRPGGRGIRRPPRGLPPPLPQPAGQRALARPVPPLGLRGGVRLADRCRPGDLHQDGGALPHDRPGRADRQSRHRAGHRRAVRTGARAGRPARAGHHQHRRPRRVPPPLHRRRARRPLRRGRLRAGDRPGLRRRPLAVGRRWRWPCSEQPGRSASSGGARSPLPATVLPSRAW